MNALNGWLVMNLRLEFKPGYFALYHPIQCDPHGDRCLQHVACVWYQQCWANLSTLARSLGQYLKNIPEKNKPLRFIPDAILPRLQVVVSAGRERCFPFQTVCGTS